jgi:hypothetical protein
MTIILMLLLLLLKITILFSNMYIFYSPASEQRVNIIVYNYYIIIIIFKYIYIILYVYVVFTCERAMRRVACARARSTCLFLIYHIIVNSINYYILHVFQVIAHVLGVLAWFQY